MFECPAVSVLTVNIGDSLSASDSVGSSLKIKFLDKRFTLKSSLVKRVSCIAHELHRFRDVLDQSLTVGLA